MKYDAIVISSGQGGNPLSFRLADLGWRVALIHILSVLMLEKFCYTLLKGAVYIRPILAEGFFALMGTVKPAD